MSEFGGYLDRKDINAMISKIQKGTYTHSLCKGGAGLAELALIGPTRTFPGNFCCRLVALRFGLVGPVPTASNKAMCGGMNFQKYYIFSDPDPNSFLKYVIFHVLSMSQKNHISGSRGGSGRQAS